VCSSDLWNGKYRRPAELSAQDFQKPLQTEMLWVYEGLTSYLSMVLTARSGLWTADQFRDQLAALAMQSAYQPGRRWRSLEDTAVAAQVLFDASPAWTSWRRGTDFYDEGALIWLEADVIIRQQTHRRHSLDDFARLFFGGQTSGSYTFNEIVSALNQVAAYDWRKFFDERVSRVAPQAPLEGIRQGGWLVAYTEAPTEMIRIRQEMERTLDATPSIGLIVQAEGVVVDTVYGMASALAGLAPGMRIVAVNGRKFSPRVLLEAMQEGSANRQALLQLLVENAEFYKTVSLDYHGGPRYPRLLRDESRPDLLTEILKPRTGSQK
jgi:predicted metalloprotease with PDZ domain